MTYVNSVRNRLTSNRKQRVSYSISYQQAMTFRGAIDLFAEAGKPVNTMLTVNLERLGISPRNCSSFTQASLQRLRRLLERAKSPWAVAWVLENVGPIGVHLHALIHRTKEFELDHFLFRKMVLKAFKVSKPVTRSIKIHKFRSWRASHDVNLENLQRYFLKGIRPEVAHEFFITPKPQGMIYGARVGVVGLIQNRSLKKL